MNNLLKNKRGVTLLEMIVAVGLLSMVLIGTMSLLSTMLNLWAEGSSGTSSNLYASVAARGLVRAIEEGRSATIVNGKLTVRFPYRPNSSSDYSSGTGDLNEYYLSGPSGTEASGTYLWRRRNYTRYYLIGKNITSLTFSMPSKKLIRFTLIGSDIVGEAVRPNTIQVSVLLRNS